MRNNKFLVLLIFVLILGQVLVTNAAPEVIRFGTHSAGTGAYMLVSLSAEGIIESSDALVRCIPSETESGRARMAKEGEADTTAVNSLAAWCLQEGLFEFSYREWGPQPVRYLWIPQHVGAPMTVRGDSDIYKIEDLKGKRVADFPGSPSCHLMNEALLAFGGLTWDDVVVVPETGPAAAYDAVIKKKIDATFFNLTGSKAYELASMSCGIRYLEVPPENKEGWKRLKEVAPIMSPRKSCVGANLSENNCVYTMSQGYPTFLAWSHLDEEKAYQITKLLHEAYPVYAEKNNSLKNDWTLEKTLYLFDNDVVSMHEGSVRYFKEIGVWNEELEQKNQVRIDYQEKLKNLWESTIKEAEEKGIKDNDFPEFWMEKRRSAGLWVN